MPDGAFAIGIDFGTSSCSVGIFRNGELEIFKDENGSSSIPSYVSFTHRGTLTGQDAKEQITINHKRTIYGMKRLIGKQNQQEEMENLGLSWQTYKGKIMDVIQVTGTLFASMKTLAERHLRTEIRTAVISVPGHFDQNQHDAIVAAGKWAGFSEVSITEEPKATAIAIENTCNYNTGEKILVADFGGGFFSLSIARVKANNVQILATESDELGGLDFDNELFELLIKDKKAELILAIEDLKKVFGKNDAYPHSGRAANDIDIKINVSRKDFLVHFEVVLKIFQGVLKELFSKLKMKEQNISTIALVGKNWQNPSIKRCFLSFWPEDRQPRILMPSHSVLHGTAIKASKLH